MGVAGPARTGVRQAALGSTSLPGFPTTPAGQAADSTLLPGAVTGVPATGRGGCARGEEAELPGAARDRDALPAGEGPDRRCCYSL